MPTSRTILIAIAGLCLAVGPVVAQTTTSDPIRVGDLEVVDQGVADLHDLSASLRAISAGLAEPVGFERVYRVPGSDDMLMRVNGGLYAVFPHSRYVPSRIGPVAVVPDGTTFYIGPPPPTPTPRGLHDDSTQVKTRIGAAVDHRHVPAAQPDSDAPPGLLPLTPIDLDNTAPSMTSDAVYRRTRLSELLRTAARSERWRAQAARGPSSSSK